MCWRDEEQSLRYCFVCGGRYFGPLGHVGCTGPKTSVEERQDEIGPKPQSIDCLCSLATGKRNPELVHHTDNHCGGGYTHTDGSVQCGVCWISINGPTSIQIPKE